MMKHDLRIYGSADEKTVEQMNTCLEAEEGAIGVLCADNHLGYSQPVGAAVAYRDHISVSGVGFDIGCGNKAVRTNLSWSDIQADMPRIMDEVTGRLSFGMGRKSGKRIDHPVIDEIRQAEFTPQRELASLAANQLGTIGSGNHYVDIFVDTETDTVWIGVHFGSRGFGHKTASGFFSLAEGKPFDAKGSDGEIMSPPVLFHKDSGLGQSYIRAMDLAGRYAHAGRDVVCEEVLDILGAVEVDSVHNHHNFAWREQHDGEYWWVVRKGCTPAFPGQRGFVGASMGENSVILEGTGAAESSLFSTVHGAGRAMSRSKAGGKWQWRRACYCGWVQPKGSHAPKDRLCPDCSREVTKKRVQVRAGAIDFDQVKSDISRKGIILKGAAADEAPGAYKRLSLVLDAMGDTIQVERELRPVGVAMAGPDVNDPYKD